MKSAPIPDNEAERLKALERYHILDTAPEAAFDDLTQLASQLCDAPISLVSLVDEERQWFKSRLGLDLMESPRDESFCAYTILQADLMVVSDARTDERFADIPMVSSRHGVRFYAGMPLITPQGHAIGTLCVCDRIPRQLTPTQLAALKTLARQVITQLELRLHLSELEREVAKHQLTERALRSTEEKYRSIFENVVEGIFQTTADGRYLSANPMLAKIYGFASPEEMMANFSDISRQLYVDPGRRAEFVRLMEQNDVISKFESQIYQQNGTVIWISENARAVRDAAGKLLFYEGTVEDITDRKRAEETLLISEKRFRSVWQNSSDGMRLMDKDGVIRGVNPCFCQIVGLKAEEVEGQPFTVLYADSENPEQMLETYKERFAARTIERHLERRMKFRSGKVSDVELSNSFVEADSKDVMVLTIYHDISERKRTEEALQESEILYHSLVENLPQNIFRKDAQERFTFANQRFCNLLGKTREEIIGKTDFDLFPSELASKYQRDDQKIMQSGQTYETVEAHHTPDQGKIYVQVVKTPLYDATGTLNGIQGMFWDVTERRKIEDQLAFERDLLRALMDNVPDRIYFKDTDSRFLRCSLAMATRLGLSDPDEVVGKTDFDFHPRASAQEFYEDEQRIILTGQPLVNKHERQIAHDGSEIWASVTKVPTRNKAGFITGIIGISRDITELKRTEKELAVARDAALESARMKSEFLATMSHEIRTPMNGVIGMSDLLLATQLSDEQRDFAETIRSSADALLHIINDILDFSKIEAGRITFEQIDLDLREAVEGTVELLAHRAQTKGLELVSFVPDDVPTKLRGDPGRLRQVLLNLVGNAVKFTEQGEVLVQVQKAHETASTILLRFEVVDTGIGISNDTQTRIFQAFTQADGSTTRKYGGTGLGLSISKQLVELMGGEIGVESSPNHGSTFWFTITFDKQVAPPAEAQPIPPPHLAGVRVLVVDDNPTNRKILLHQTRAWEMIGDEASNGRDALRMITTAKSEEQPYGLVILDMQMPEMDGLTLASEIFEDPVPPAPKMVMLTSMGQRLDQEILDSVGINACQLKPIKQSRLADCLTAVMAGKSYVPPAVPPVKDVTQAPIRSRTSSLVPGQLHILMAEDNVVNQKVALLQLKKLGFSADTVTDGQQVLNILNENHYAVILMDCQMPVMDGYAATREIRRREAESDSSGKRVPPVYIIAMTANAQSGDRERCLEAGMDDYVMKPVQLPELQAALDRIALPGKSAEEPKAKPEMADTLDLSVIESLRELREPDQPDPVIELVDLFLSDAPERLEQIASGLSAEDFVAVCQGAHSLKGSANNIGARKLATLSGKLEQQAKSGNLARADQMIEALKLEFAQARDLLEAEKQR